MIIFVFITIILPISIVSSLTNTFISVSAIFLLSIL